KARHEKPTGKGDKEKPAADDGGKQTADAGFDRLLLNSAKDEVKRAEEELRLGESSYFSLAHYDFFKKAAAERMERARANLKLAETNLNLAQEAQTRKQPAEKTSPEKRKSYQLGDLAFAVRGRNR